MGIYGYMKMNGIARKEGREKKESKKSSNLKAKGNSNILITTNHCCPTLGHTLSSVSPILCDMLFCFLFLSFFFEDYCNSSNYIHTTTTTTIGPISSHLIPIPIPPSHLIIRQQRRPLPILTHDLPALKRIPTQQSGNPNCQTQDK